MTALAWGLILFGLVLVTFAAIGALLKFGRPIPTGFEFRRTLTTLAFCGAGLALLPVLAWMTWLIQDDSPHVFQLAMGVIVLLGIVLVGLSFTVAMRQISMKGFGADFSASGGDDDRPAAKVTTTTETTVTAPETAS